MRNGDAVINEMLVHVNLLATRALLVKLMEELFRQSGDPAAKADEWLDLFEASAAKMTFPNTSPDWSDVAAQEFRDALVQIVGHARSLAVLPRVPEAARPKVPA